MRKIRHAKPMLGGGGGGDLKQGLVDAVADGLEGHVVQHRVPARLDQGRGRVERL